jgi:hypothetical protein
MGRNNRRENSSRINHDYKVGDKILLKKPGKHLRKLEAPRTGPQIVTAIYTNGAVRIQKGAFCCSSPHLYLISGLTSPVSGSNM